MIEVSTSLIKKAVYELCFRANICLNNSVYSKILNAYNNEQNLETKKILNNILKNAEIAYTEKLPLCQDTGQVIVFLKIGQEVLLTGEFIEAAINTAVKQCYSDNFFRKSVVSNSVFNRANTKTNTPCIIYTEYTNGENVEISVLIKGAGSENKSRLKMLLPTVTETEIIKECADMISESLTSACPPMFVGIGIGATADKAMVMSKKALVSEDFTNEEINLARNIKNEVNKNISNEYKNIYVLDVKLKTMPTHIACMPVGITINCHSDRYSCAQIIGGEIRYIHEIPDFKGLQQEDSEQIEINTNDIERLSELKSGETVLLTGEIYVARDMAHKKMIELLEENKPLPFDIADKIIFYAGPCPAKIGEVIGSIGPTTSSRMDKYAAELYKRGLFATIGKGERSKEVIFYLKESGKKYFTIQGGIAAMLAKTVKRSDIIAFNELEPESVYKIYVERIPVKVEI